MGTKEEFKFKLEYEADSKLTWHEIIRCVKNTSYNFNVSEKEVLEYVAQTLNILQPPMSLSIDILTDNMVNDILKPRELTKLRGPTEFLFYQDILGKRILLLGEKHERTTECKDDDMYEVEDWLDDLSDISTECLDIFSEKPYMTPEFKKRYPRSMYQSTDKNKLTKINETFIFKASDTTRYHHVDVRHTFDVDIPNNKYKEYHTPEIQWTMSKKETGKVISYKSFQGPPLKKEKAIEFIKHILHTVRTTWTDKEYDDYINSVNEMAGGKFENSLSFTNKMLKEMGKVTIIDEYQLRRVLADVYIKMLDNSSFLEVLLSLTMDVYVLMRLFITFDENKMNRGPKLCRDSESRNIKNVIIYTGYGHTQTYKAVFEKMFDAKPDINLKSYDQCIRLKEPFDFFGKYDKTPNVELKSILRTEPKTTQKKTVSWDPNETASAPLIKKKVKRLR